MTLLVCGSTVPSDVEGGNAIVLCVPVGKDPIEHGRFVGGLRRIGCSRRRTEIRRGIKDKKCHRDEGPLLQESNNIAVQSWRRDE